MMTATISSISRVSNKISPHDNLFQKIEGLELILSQVQFDLLKLDEEAKNIHEEKHNVEAYLEQRAESTRNKLMFEIKQFQVEVYQKIETTKRETTKLDQKIHLIKQGQLSTLQMVLSLQRRIRQVEVQLGTAE